jgi:hypothetical protein
VIAGQRKRGKAGTKKAALNKDGPQNVSGMASETSTRPRSGREDGRRPRSSLPPRVYPALKKRPGHQTPSVFTSVRLIASPLLDLICLWLCCHSVSPIKKTIGTEKQARCSAR